MVLDHQKVRYFKKKHHHKPWTKYKEAVQLTASSYGFFGFPPIYGTVKNGTVATINRIYWNIYDCYP